MAEVDVVIVGAGISGIGAAYHLQTICPSRTFTILEGRPDLGGTWDLFRYPGVRSDSDMHTLGFNFKPWTAAKAIADGPSILEYLNETVDEFGIRSKIRFNNLVRAAHWDSASNEWRLEVDNNGTRGTVTCNYLFMCSGYYSYKGGYDPDFPGKQQFTGRIVHPQKWPNDLDFEGKKVAVIGSGATAMTIVPSMATNAAHVTMIQRSPTYVVARPDVDRVANLLRKVLPEATAYKVVRWKNTTLQQFFYRKTRESPEPAKERLLKMVTEALPDGYPVDEHFTPSYNPWDQRLCLLPNGDLFEAIKNGTASVVTGTIDSFTPTGIRMSSGDHVEADIIVTATGLNLVTLGEMDFTVDGEQVDFASTFTYKGFAYSGIPNMASSFGYINASWTLRSDLIAEYVCRLLDHMDKVGAARCTPVLKPGEESMERRPWITGFTPGYMNRVMHMFPSQGDHEPWINPQNFSADREMFRKGAVDDGTMEFAGVTAAATRV